MEDDVREPEESVIPRVHRRANTTSKVSTTAIKVVRARLYTIFSRSLIRSRYVRSFERSVEVARPSSFGGSLVHSSLTIFQRPFRDRVCEVASIGPRFPDTATLSKRVITR